MKALFTLISSFLFYLNCFSQTNPDSSFTQSQIQRHKIFIQSSLNNVLSDSTIIKPDTSLKFFHRITPYKKSPNIPLGLSGQKYYPLTLSKDFFLPVNFPDFSFEIFRFNAYSLPSKPYFYRNIGASLSNLKFVTGSGGEQYVNVFHIQNIKKAVTLFLEGQKIYSDGVYPKQLGDIGNGRGGVGVNLKGFMLKADYSFSNSLIQENGGIADDVDISLFTGTDIGGMPVLLPNAFNQLKRKEGNLDIAYSFINNKKDSVPGKLFLHTGIKGQLKSVRKLYYDNLPTQDYFENYYIDSLSSYDSMAVSSASLKPYIRFGSKSISLAASYKISNHSAHIQFPVNNIQNHIAGAEAAVFRPHLDFLASIESTVSGYNAGNYSGNARAKFKNLLKGNFILSTTLASFNQPYTREKYFSNHFIWDSTFTNTALQEFSFDYLSDSLRLKTGITYLLLNNPVFLNQTGLPVQLEGLHSLLSFNVEKHLSFRRLHFVPEVILQESSSELFRVPSFVTRLNLYLETYIFKNALLVQPGVDFTYFTSFNAYGYSPALQDFTLYDGFKADSFPYLDVYLSFNVKTVRAFVMLENSLAGFAGHNYFIMPGYPAANRNLKLGLSWNFFN